MLKKFVLPSILVIISASAAFWLYVQKPKPAERTESTPVLLVEVLETDTRTVELNVTAHGTVTPHTQTTLASEVSGQILEVSPAFVSGGFFKKGAMLVRIDDRNYQADLKRAEAAVAAARTVLVREKGLADYAREDWEKLHRSDAATELALRKPQVAEAQAQLAFAEADLKRKQGDLERTTIRAPYDGMIRQKQADVGQFVNPATPLVQVFAVDMVEVRLPLPEKDLPYLALDDQPGVLFSAEIGGTKHHWQGQIVRTEGVFDTASRVLYAVAQVADPYNQRDQRWGYPLRVGTFVNAEISGYMVDEVIVLPRNVLRRGNQVWTIGPDSELVPRQVTLLRADENQIYISGGLEDKPLVCLTTLENPLPGTIVRFNRGTAGGD